MTGAHRYVARTTKREDGSVFIGFKQTTREQARRIFVGQITRLTCGLEGRVLRTDPSGAVWVSIPAAHNLPTLPDLASTKSTGSTTGCVDMENGTVKKGRNLLEGFVWPIDTGRLMGDAVS